jgi:hydrogenase maturation factor
MFEWVQIVNVHRLDNVLTGSKNYLQEFGIKIITLHTCRFHYISFFFVVENTAYFVYQRWIQTFP